MASHQSLKKSDLFTVGNLISLIIKGFPPDFDDVVAC